MKHPQIHLFIRKDGHIVDESPRIFVQNRIRLENAVYNYKFWSMKTSSEILEHNGLRKTAIRLRVLDVFLQSKEALSHALLETELDETDRVTLYRTLKTFEEKGIIHKAEDGTGVGRFALCHADSCADHKHDDEHAHFHCEKCGKTVCLEQVIVPQVNLPEGFSGNSSHLIIKGTCEQCVE